jgi:uncharacterized protein YkwD
MSRGIVIAGAIAVLNCCGLGAGNAGADDGACAAAGDIADDATVEQAVDAVLCLVNGERAQHGLRPVRASSALTRSAQAHSRDMVQRGYFSHVTPSGENARQRVVQSGYARKRGARKVGETIAWGSGERGTPAELVRLFMTSAPHRGIVLDPRFRDVGIGLVPAAPVATAAAAGVTLTIDFGRRR